MVFGSAKNPDSGFFGNQPSLDDAMKELTNRFRTFCSVRGIEPLSLINTLFELALLGVPSRPRCSQCWLSSGMLHDDSTGWPALRLKAYNGRVFLLYVRTALHACKKQSAGLQATEMQEITLAALAADSLCLFFSLTEQADRYLSEEESQSIHKAGMVFLRCYTSLAKLAASMGVRRWHLLPKMHATCLKM